MDQVSYFVLNNLHCPSCVFAIKSALSLELGILPANVHVERISQTITIRHGKSIARGIITRILENVGFELEDDEAHWRRLSGLWFPEPLSSSERRRLHLEVCKACQTDETKTGKRASMVSFTRAMSRKSTVINSAYTEMTDIPEHVSRSPSFIPADFALPNTENLSNENPSNDAETSPPTSSLYTDVMRNSASKVRDSSSTIYNDAFQSSGRLRSSIVYIQSLLSIRRESQVTSEGSEYSEAPAGYHLEFHIGGMTCAACSSTVTSVLEDEPYIKTVHVNFMGNCGAVTLSNKDDVQKVKEAVETLGFSCDLGDITPLGVRKASPESENIRVVRIRIDGMISRYLSLSLIIPSYCPNRVADALSSIPGVIDSTFVSLSNPVSVVRYRPNPPETTLRTLFSALELLKYAPALEKRVSIEEQCRLAHARERRKVLRLFIIAVIIAIPTFVIGIVYMALLPSDSRGVMWWSAPLWGNASRAVIALFFLATPVQFYVAVHFHRRAFHGLTVLWRKGSKVPVWKRFIRFGSMDLLITLGTSVAYFSSFALLIMSALEPPSNTSMNTYFDTTVFLAMFILLGTSYLTSLTSGRNLEAYAKHKAADAVSLLSGLRPMYAILDNAAGEEARISVDMLEIGDLVKVPNGSTPPGDGVIVSGQSKFDESSLTGEARLVHKEVGDSVYVGTINGGSVVTIKLHAIGGSSMLDKIIDVVRQGESNRAPIERFAEVLTGYFVPCVVFTAILTWAIWLSLGLSGVLPSRYLSDVGQGGPPLWSLKFAIAVFVAACPCGIGLAAPTACFVGSGLAAKHGILVRGGGEAFQEASVVDCVVFDKTGTLTQGGEPQVTDCVVLTEDRDRIMAIASELEQGSTHTLALAIRSFCQPTTQCAEIVVEEMEEIGGRGIKSTLVFDGDSVEAIIGNEVWMGEQDASYPPTFSFLDIWKSQGKSVVVMALRSSWSCSSTPERFRVVAFFAISDPLREEAPHVIKQLASQGIATWMISGDNLTTAKAVAAMVGIRIDHVIAGVMPHQKAEKIQWLQKTAGKRARRRWWSFSRPPLSVPESQQSGRSGRRAIVAMVGDGINDAPALTVSDLGIAMGGGSDVALGSAKFILLSSNLMTILTLFDLSKVVFRRIKFNFFWYDFAPRSG
jgi:P-type Cu+ transporter